jgi:carbon-monoxide dehydrogenase small subunit
MKCALQVNGDHIEVEVEPRALLVDLLRDRLGLTGTKVGCDTAQCGSCVVDLDGATVKSCQVLAVQATGSAVVTIEGISDRGTDAGGAVGQEGRPAGLTDLQDRLWRTHGVQCGFCTPGVVMALRELLAEDATPTRAQVHTSLAGNLCRCTGYTAIVEAVLDATAPAAPARVTTPGAETAAGTR